jgi:hypothetical protein
MPSPSYSQNKASIKRYKAKNADKIAPLQREYNKMYMRRCYAYKAGVRQLLNILVNFFDD